MLFHHSMPRTILKAASELELRDTFLLLFGLTHFLFIQNAEDTPVTLSCLLYPRYLETEQPLFRISGFLWAWCLV